MEPVHRRAAAPLDPEVRGDGLRQAEEEQRLVDEVRAQVVPEPRSRPRPLAPPVPDLGPMPADLRPELHHVSHRAAGDGPPHAEKVAVPAAILEDREHPSDVGRQRRQPPRLAEGEGERLVHHHMLARAQRRLRQRGVAVVGRGDHDEVGRGMPGGGERVGQRLHFGVARLGGRAAGAEGGEPEAGGRRDQRRVEHAARVAHADHHHPDRRQRGLSRATSARMPSASRSCGSDRYGAGPSRSTSPRASVRTPRA